MISDRKKGLKAFQHYNLALKIFFKGKMELELSHQKTKLTEVKK